MEERGSASEIRVLVVDDHPVVREGLAGMLGLHPGLKVVAALADGSQAVDYMRDSSADVVLCDLRMPGISGIETIRALKSIAPEAVVIVLSAFELDEDIYQAVEAGASGYLLKEMDGETIAAAVREAFDGGHCLPRRIAERLAARRQRGALTSREREILELVARGLTNREIASALHLSQFTVRNHINRLSAKLQVSDRTEAVFFAVQTGLIPVSQ